MARVELAKPANTFDFWPANSVESWKQDPKRSFLTWLADQRVIGDQQFRTSSKDTYAAMFSWWLKSLEDKKLTLLEASGKDATSFFEATKLEPHSRRRYLQLLDRVYCYLRKIGWPGENPIQIELKKERELELALPAGLTEQQVLHAIQVLEEIPGWKGHRDRCAAALLLGAGLRVSELSYLRQEDVSAHYAIELKQHSIYKEHSTLILPEGPWRQWFDAWLIQRRTLGINGEWLCPATKNGKAFSPSGVFRRAGLWLAPMQADLPHAGPNLLRNTFARQALLCGRYQIAQVQEFLGHVELRATSRHLAALEAFGIS